MYLTVSTFQKSLLNQENQMLGDKMPLLVATIWSCSACGTFMFSSIVLMSLLTSPPCNEGTILVSPMEGGPRINMKIMIEEIHARGNSIDVIRLSNSGYIKKEFPLSVIGCTEWSLPSQAWLLGRAWRFPGKNHNTKRWAA
jgi:hypothetical protein